MRTQYHPDISVAVVIPNRNYGQYLDRALWSATRQTHPPSEVIVVDGESTDNSINVAKRYEVTWISRKPRGMADARNVGIAAAKAEYIVPLDADDWIASNYIERCLTARGPSVGVIAPGLVWPDGRVQWPIPPFTHETFMTGNRLFCCSMFRRECWEQVGGYDTNPTYEDWAFWFSIVEAGWTIEVLHEPLFHYNAHLDSSTTNMKPGQHEQYVQYIHDKFRRERV